VSSTVVFGLVLAGSLGALRWRASRRERAWQTLVDSSVGIVVSSDLTPRLRELVRQARILRQTLQTPVLRLRSPVIYETPWGRRARCVAYDRAVCDVRRAVWEWRSAFARLGAHERHALRERGVHRIPLAALFGPTVERSNDPWEQVLWVRAPDPSRVVPAFAAAVADLRWFERALALNGRSPYRAVA